MQLIVNLLVRRLGSLYMKTLCYLFAELMRIYSSICIEIRGVGAFITELINLSFASKTMDLISLMKLLFLSVMNVCWGQERMLNSNSIQGTKTLQPSSSAALIVLLCFLKKLLIAKSMPYLWCWQKMHRCIYQVRHFDSVH